MKRLYAAIFLIVLIAVCPALTLANSSTLIISGVPGDPEHSQKFEKWTDGTRKVLVEKLGFSPDRVIVLADKKSGADEIRKAFAQLKEQLKPGDDFFLFMIGHGSFEDEYKFNIFGPDLTAADYSKLLSTLNAGRIVIVNATSASGGSIDALSAKNRIVITATKSGMEGNETVFYDYFLQALQSPDADEDKDGKVSVWEAFKYAANAVDRYYKDEGRLMTEHAQMSDNGPEKFTAVAKEPPPLARITMFQVQKAVTVSDPKLQAMINDRDAIQKKIDDLRVNKASMPQADYDKQMEDLLIQLALKNQEIKAKP